MTYRSASPIVIGTPSSSAGSGTKGWLSTVNQQRAVRRATARLYANGRWSGADCWHIKLGVYVATWRRQIRYVMPYRSSFRRLRTCNAV